MTLPERRIIGFHQDQQGAWVAELACGHTQHVRHTPPWMSRPWVTTKEGRQSRLGSVLGCKLCEQQQVSLAESADNK